MNVIKTVCIAAAAGSLALFAGCAQQGVVYADDTERVVTTDLDIQDVERFSRELAEALVSSGSLGASGEPDTVVIESYKNETSQPDIDRDRVLFPLLTTLNRSNVARAYMGTTVAGSGLKTVEAEQERSVFEGRDTGRKYDYSVLVKLYEDRARSGRTRQVSYILQFQVIDVDAGTPVWMDQRTITKQTTRSGMSG
ncbi:MAG: hypothetical protein AAGG07_05600 [Planctomycetota bacterium]